MNDLKVVDVDDISGMIDKWHKAVRKSNPKAIDTKVVFENLGFTDIKENEDGSLDASLDDERFLGLKLPGLEISGEPDQVNISFKYDSISELNK